MQIRNHFPHHVPTIKQPMILPVFHPLDKNYRIKNENLIYLMTLILFETQSQTIDTRNELEAGGKGTISLI